MNKFIWCAISFIAGVILTIIISLTSCNNNSGSQVLYVHDTTIVERFNTEIKRDTVVKWYEKIVTKENKPEVVYYNTVDSIFIAQFKDHDVILQVKKTGSDLYIYALNENGKLLKQYVYHDVGNNFTSTSQANNVFVKSQLWYWDGITNYIETSLPFEKVGKDFYNSLNYKAGIETGINYKNKLDLKLGVERNFTIGVNEIKLKTEYKLF
jgi:hypothetical protein